MEEESCCWYACANSITFFARTITPTAPIMESTRVFRLLMGLKTSDTPDAWTGRAYMDTAVMIPAAMGTIRFFILPFLLNVVTVIVSLFIMVGFLSLIKISDYWLLWFCFYRLAVIIFFVLLSSVSGLVFFYLKMAISEIVLTEYLFLRRYIPKHNQILRLYSGNNDIPILPGFPFQAFRRLFIYDIHAAFLSGIMDVPFPLTVTAPFEHGVLEGIELEINHRVTATDQNNALFIIQLPYFIGRHKFFATLSSDKFNFTHKKTEIYKPLYDLYTCSQSTSMIEFI